MAEPAEKLVTGVKKVKVINKLGGSLAADEDDSPAIKVCVRVRPFIREEIEGDRCGGKVECCIAMPTTTAVEMLGREEPRRFEFDRCYWSHNEDHPLFATQQTLQDEMGQTLINSALSGYNNCIFAYGQTGSGKSFSVLGGKGDARGLLPRVVEGLFEHFESLDESVIPKCQVSFIEIYNEQIRDLFAVKEDGQKELPKLEVKQDKLMGTVISGLTTPTVNSCEEVMKLVDYGTTMRHVAETAMNASSSRSHCIFSFRTSVTAAEGGVAKMSYTHLVDLAGSERAGRTKATGQRLKEGAAINQSLSVLATVIRELAKQSTKKKSNPPFRGSKLTYILKESLAGNSKTVMMAAISPTLTDYDETLSTMNFAKSVKQVQTKAVVNQVNEKGVEEALRAELDELRTKLAVMELHAQRGGGGMPPAVDGGDFGGGEGGGYDEGRGSVVAHGRRHSAHIERRLKETEQLCRWFGKDWDDLLAEERNRQQKRAAILHTDNAMEELRKMMGVTSQPQEEAEADADADATTAAMSDDAAAAPSDALSDSEASATDQEMRLTARLLYLRKPGTDDEVRDSVRVGSPSFIAVAGPRAASCKAAEGQAEQHSAELRRVRASAARAEEAVAKLSSPTLPRLLLRAVVGIEPGEVGQETTLEILVHAYHAAVEDQTRTAHGGCRVSTGEWMTEETLGKRLAWLEAAEKEEVMFDKDAHDGDAWQAAIEGVKPVQEPPPPEEPPEPEEPPGEPAEIVASRSAAREAQRLNEELSNVQDELSRLKKMLRKEKQLGQELREELSGTQEELARARAKARTHQHETKVLVSEEVSKLREELDMAKDELARSEPAGEAERLRADLQAAREELARRDAGSTAAEEIARLRQDLDAARDEIESRDRVPTHQELQRAGIHVDALGNVRLQSTDIAKAIALTFDSAISAIDIAQAELDRVGQH